MATEFVGNFFGNPEKAVASGTDMEMVDADKQVWPRRDQTFPNSHY